MRIAELFDPDCMTMDLQATDKWGAIAELAALLVPGGRISSLEQYLQAVREREAQVSTGVGMGIGIPHGKSDAVLLPTIAFGRSWPGIAWDSIDEQPVYLLFLLAVPASYGDREYMQTLAKLARLLVHETFRQKLMAARTKPEILSAIQESEEAARRVELP